MYLRTGKLSDKKPRGLHLEIKGEAGKRGKSKLSALFGNGKTKTEKAKECPQRAHEKIVKEKASVYKTKKKYTGGKKKWGKNTSHKGKKKTVTEKGKRAWEEKSGQFITRLSEGGLRQHTGEGRGEIGRPADRRLQFFP